MNLQSTLEIYAGGPGSGCQGPNCGRKAGLTFEKEGENFVGYHVTPEENVENVNRFGIMPTERDDWGKKPRNGAFLFANLEHAKEMAQSMEQSGGKAAIFKASIAPSLHHSIRRDKTMLPRLSAFYLNNNGVGPRHVIRIQ